MSHIEKEKLIKADIASIENRVRHAFNQGYDLGFKDGKEKAKPLEQETQTFKWCTDCKEYDQEKHCCHRWSKVIRDTVEEMKQEPKTGHWIDCDNSDDYSADGYDCSVCGVNAEYATSYCPNCGAKMVEPQESEGKG